MGHPGATAHRERTDTVDTQRIIEAGVFRPTEAEQDTHPHACTDGLVFLTYTFWDELVGEEVERIEAVPCLRCAEYREAV
jgi:hypothetical protein